MTPRHRKESIRCDCIIATFTFFSIMNYDVSDGIVGKACRGFLVTYPGGISYYREGQPAKEWAQRVQGKPIVNLNILDRYLKNPMCFINLTVT